MNEEFFVAAVASFILPFICVPIVFGLARLFGLYAIVPEGRCHVYVLFGKVIGVIEDPGLYCLWSRLGWKGFFVRLVGRCQVVDMRVDQQYLRSQPVNSEEGAPMGIGIWYEMFVSDPVSYLFKNFDPRGSLAANVSNATVRCLSNMPLAEMLENRHTMSQTVRTEVSAQSQEWGYKVGSIYIRKVHFRDREMIKQIEEKVVNRLRQVTSAITQDGANQVNIITSTAERQAAIEFAKAYAMRTQIVGAALQKMTQDPDIANAVFETLENQRLLEGNAGIMLIPPKAERLADLLAAEAATAGAPTSRRFSDDAGTVASQAEPRTPRGPRGQPEAGQ